MLAMKATSIRELVSYINDLFSLHVGYIETKIDPNTRSFEEKTSSLS
jgi:hypothetical protein